MSWRDQWDDEATREQKELRNRPVAELLAMVREGRYGSYHMLWAAIAERASLKEAGWDLFGVVSDGTLDLLPRYHAASALIQLLGMKDVEATDFTVEWRGASQHIARARSLLEERIGPPQR